MSPLRRLPDRLEALSPRIAQGLLISLGALLALRLLGMTWLLSVNVPFSDQWALLTRLYNGFQWSDVPAAFFWQHGPHRQGLAFALALPAYHLSDWNVRLESLWLAFVQLASGALALRLRRSLVPAPWSVWDALLLLPFFGVAGFETMWVAPNGSHSVVPLFLLMWLVNVWLWAPGVARTATIAVLAVALGFTGFGLTALPVLGLVFVVEVWRGPATQRGHALSLALTCLLTLAAFLVNYRFVVSAEGFEVFRPNPLDYLQFVTALLSHFVLMAQRVSWWWLYPVGAVFLAAMLAVFGWGLRQLVVRSDDPDTSVSRHFWPVCVMLVGCSLVFALLTAYGRVQLGVHAAVASRYTVLTLPAWAAICLVLFRYRQRTAPLLLALLVLLLLRTVPETKWAHRQGRYIAAMKLCWMTQYQATGGSVKLADERLVQLDSLRAYQAGWMGLQAQWDFMERQRLGPLAPSANPAPLLGFYPQPCELLKTP